MVKKLTQEEADKLDKKYGAIPIGQYINCMTKREYKCSKCDQSYFCTPTHIRRNKRTLCNQCAYNKRGILKRLSKEYIDKIIKSKGFKLIKCYYKKGRALVTVQCKCGKVFDTVFDSIKQELAKTCGHCNDPKIGDKFGNLTVIMVFPNRSNGCSVICKCNCGKDTKKIQGFNLTRTDFKQYRSCGNCQLKRNGNFTSYTALELHKTIEKITNIQWEHNLHIKNCGCIDIANEQIKIAIEYDGYYNHKIRNGDQTQQNKDKINKLIQNGWKVLHIKSGGRDIPTEKQLRKVLLNDFQHGARKRTITMKSWKDAEERYKKQ